MRFRFALITAVLLGISCSTTSHPGRIPSPSIWTGSRLGGQGRFSQSCGLACGAPISPSTGELLAPATTQVNIIGRITQAAELIQGFITVSRFLDEAQKGIVEDILWNCVREANAQVDEQLFGKGRSLPDSECKKEPVVQDKLGPDWQRHLGKLKHSAAFECIQRKLAEKFPDNFTIEPRLRKDKLTGEVLLTDRRVGSLLPDVVIHFTRAVTRIQCIYDLKFPCGYATGKNPWSEEVLLQMNSYGALGGECAPALITPQRGVVRQ